MISFLLVAWLASSTHALLHHSVAGHRHSLLAKDSVGCAREERFEPSHFYHSNIGGQGPDFHAPRTLFYGNVFPYSGRVIDMEITNVSYFELSLVGQKLRKPPYGFIPLETTGNLTMRFRFMDRETQQPTSVGPWFLTATEGGLNASAKTTRLEVTLPQASESQVAADTAVVTSGGSYILPGVELQHPAFALDNSDDWGALSFLMPAASEFNISIHILADSDFHETEDEVAFFLFTGASDIACPEVAACSSMACPAGFQLVEHANYIPCLTAVCTVEQDQNVCCKVAEQPQDQRAACSTMTCPMDYMLRVHADTTFCEDSVCTPNDASICCFHPMDDSPECNVRQPLVLLGRELMYSNLGNMGPDFGMPAGILYGDVFPYSGVLVDMEVVNLTGYHSKSTSRNGMHGWFANINIHALTSTKFRFRFFERLSGTPFVPEPFTIAFFDFDQMKRERCIEQVAITNLSSYVVSNDTTLTVGSSRTQDAVFDTFASSTYGTDDDNPINPMHLTRSQLAKAITAVMGSVSEFFIEFNVSKGWGGRNFLFAGASNMACPVLGKCDSYTCPEGFQQIPDASSVNCVGTTCNLGDLTSCCVPPPYVDTGEFPVPPPANPPGESPATAVGDCADTDEEGGPITRDVCDEKAVLRLATSVVAYSNLGGLGPDFDAPAKLVFNNVFAGSERNVVMEVTNVSIYQSSDVAMNGLANSYGAINLLADRNVTLRFAFVDGDTGEPVRIPALYFKLIELQSQNFGCRCGIDFMLKENVRLQALTKAPFSQVATHGTCLKHVAASAHEPESGRALGFVLKDTDQLLLRLAAMPACVSRNIFFAGIADEQCQGDSVG